MEDRRWWRNVLNSGLLDGVIIVVGRERTPMAMANLFHEKRLKESVKTYKPDLSR